MERLTTYTMDLAGSSYEIGYQYGKQISKIPSLLALQTKKRPNFSRQETKEAIALFNRWCPGLNEELTGCADALQIPSENLLFYSMTYLIPRCSQIAVLPKISENGLPLLARNYEFSHRTEDFCFIKTAVNGRYTHMGTSVLHFGRDDGFNEQGLAVTMSSCGFPVGADSYMRGPKLKGLQFWAVIRGVLENCRNVTEALDYLEEMPIAYNLNLMLVDKSGQAALFETLDGNREVKIIDASSEQQVLFATNHAVLPKLSRIEPQRMQHSDVRYQFIEAQLTGQKNISCSKLEEMLLAKYPDGLCCPFFDEFFGTTKSMIFSPAEGIVQLLWGGEAANGWRRYDIGQPLETAIGKIKIYPQKAPRGTFDWQQSSAPHVG